jgi:hypothetical protein
MLDFWFFLLGQKGGGTSVFLIGIFKKSSPNNLVTHT